MANLAGMTVRDNNSILFIIYDYFFQSSDEIQLTLQPEHLQRFERRFGHYFSLDPLVPFHYQMALPELSHMK